MKKQFFIDNRRTLIERIKKEHPLTKGSIFLWANFEKPAQSFLQEPTFYYLTGINEPGVALKISLDGETTLFIPQTQGKRAQWMADSLSADHETAERFGIDRIEFMGEAIKGYSFPPLFNKEESFALIDELKKNEGTIFTCFPDTGFQYVEQAAALRRCAVWVPDLLCRVIDMSAIIISMRKIKQQDEIEQIFKAVQITSLALVGAAEVIEPKRYEYEVQAAVDYVCTTAGAKTAFPTIVAGGKNATILHYEKNDAELNDKELVIVDCGARVGHYCADLTRTFPVSGAFTEEQRSLYATVLECQDYIVSLIKPGMYLNNSEKPEQSLHHLACEFFDKKGLKKYFVHGIGHYVGLAPHDVGSLQDPLQAGDVITIEPGLYIPEKNIGIRIEDNYWVVPDGVHCLSEDLPKAYDEIEQLVQQSMKS